MSADFESGFETDRTGRVEHLDVIPLPGGKRGWTAKAKSRIIAESFEAGANVAEVARRHGLVPQQLYTWRGRFRARAEIMGFVPAVVEREAEVVSAPPGPVMGGQIVIETGVLAIRIPCDVSADHIERVLLAVQVSA